jgi:hypothetical protein
VGPNGTDQFGRATLIYGAGDVRVEDVPDPVLEEPTDALVRVPCSCICGSDLWPYAAREHTEHGDRIGHEFVGIVEDVGSEVPGLTSGDLVVAPFAWSDGTCEFCREGLQTSCSAREGNIESRERTPADSQLVSSPIPEPAADHLDDGGELVRLSGLGVGPARRRRHEALLEHQACLTVAKVDSIGLVVRRWIKCSAG